MSLFIFATHLTATFIKETSSFGAGNNRGWEQRSH